MIGLMITIVLFAIFFWASVFCWYVWMDLEYNLAVPVALTVLAIIAGGIMCTMIYTYCESHFDEHPDTLERNGYTYIRSDKPCEKVIVYNGYEYYLEEEAEEKGD